MGDQISTSLTGSYWAESSAYRLHLPHEWRRSTATGPVTRSRLDSRSGWMLTATARRGTIRPGWTKAFQARLSF
jgi:hypothetical protein